MSEVICKTKYKPFEIIGSKTIVILISSIIFISLFIFHLYRFGFYNPVTFIFIVFFCFYFFQPLLYFVFLNNYDVQSLHTIYLSLLCLALLILGYNFNCINLNKKNLTKTYNINLSFNYYDFIFICFIFYFIVTTPPNFEIIRESYANNRFDNIFYYLKYSIFIIFFIKGYFLRNKLFKIIYLTISLLGLLTLGSKSFFLLIVFLLIAFPTNKVLSTIFLILIPFFIFLIFKLHYKIPISDLFLYFNSYFDMYSNSQLINNFFGHGQGRTLYENELLTHMPRSLFKFKSLIYGSSDMASFHYPEFRILGGAPSFGISKWLYDFSYFAYLILPIIYFIKGIFIRLLFTLVSYGKITYIIILIPLIDELTLIPTGNSNLLIYHISFFSLLLLINFFNNYYEKNK